MDFPFEFFLQDSDVPYGFTQEIDRLDLILTSPCLNLCKCQFHQLVKSAFIFRLAYTPPLESFMVKNRTTSFIEIRYIYGKK